MKKGDEYDIWQTMMSLMYEQGQRWFVLGTGWVKAGKMKTIFYEDGQWVLWIQKHCESNM